MKKILFIFLFLLSSSAFSADTTHGRIQKAANLLDCKCTFVLIDKKRSRCEPVADAKKRRKCRKICSTKINRDMSLSEMQYRCL